VLCPTRELAQQVAEDAKRLGQEAHLWVGMVCGGLPIGPQIRELKAGVDVLVATPGRLLDHIERGTVDLSQVETLILDEADRMLDMGFRPQIEDVLRSIPRKRQTLMFSATMPNGVHALALRLCTDAEWVKATPERMAAETVEQKVYSVRPDRKVDLLIELLQDPAYDQVLVFTRTKSGADLLHARLERVGIGVTVTHGDRNMKQRTGALEAFAEGEKRVLVATDVAQRGLDIEGISHVVNFDVPRDPEDYVHRIGRTGRAGSSGSAVTLMTAADFGYVRSIERTLGYPLEKVSVPEYDYGAGLEAPEQAPAAEGRSNRAGGRLGSRSPKDLSPEELRDLLKVGT
ncbi:MAG: DEAD/DEAH box helicase, partial [Longimicrobiales bacterium]